MIRRLLNGIAASGIALTMLITSPVRAETGFGKQVGKAGRWTVYVSKDAMTDTVQCTALFDDRAQVQFAAGSLAISLRGRGGIDGYQIRLDDAPASTMRLPSRIEKEIGAVVLADATYQAILSARRLRFMALTVLGGMVQEDIDLSTTGEIKRLFGVYGCPAA